MRKKLEGFTLLEMIVSVAIIAILGAVAVPSYIRSQTKGRQAEAKASLAQIYIAERSNFSDGSTYTQCITKIGVGYPDRRFYAVTAVNDAASAVCGPNGDQLCTAYTFNSDGSASSTCVNADSAFDETVRQSGSFSIIKPATSPMALGSSMARATFTAVAKGNVSPDNITDTWTIDQNNNLLNSAPGI